MNSLKSTFAKLTEQEELTCALISVTIFNQILECRTLYTAPRYRIKLSRLIFAELPYKTYSRFNWLWRRVGRMELDGYTQ